MLKTNQLTGVVSVMFLLLIINGCFLAPCKNNCHCENYIDSVYKTSQYKKDSVFIDYTVKQWIDSSFGAWFGDYQKTHMTRGYSKIHVGPIFYSTDLLKLRAFIYIEYKFGYFDTLEYKYTDKKSNFFDSYTLNGYRYALNKPWKLFEAEEYVLFGSRSLKAAEATYEGNLLNEDYLNERDFIGVYNESDRLNTLFEPVKYLPCDPKFWVESPIWKKGNRVPGYYSFETNMNATPFSIEPLRPICKITYPDSILNLYK